MLPSLSLRCYPTVQHHLSNLCPEEEPLSSFGFAPSSPPSNGDHQTSTPAHQHALVQCVL